MYLPLVPAARSGSSLFVGVAAVWLACLAAFLAFALSACVQEPPGSLLPCPPPAPAHIHPSDGDSGVNVTDTIAVTFTRPMDSATINDTTFIVTTPSAGGPDTVPGSVVYVPEDTAAWFIPEDTLRPETPYTVTLTTDILDTTGTPLDSNITWTFITDVDPPPPPALDTTDFGDPDSLLVTWHQTANTTSYHLQVSTSPLFTTLVNDQPAIPDPSFFIVGAYVPASVIPAGTYYWRVSATGSGGTSAWSAVKSFLSGYTP